MTEDKIYEILLPKSFDYPKLNAEAATIIANNFTDIIYDTLKLKSSSPICKRLNLLKFLKTLACRPDDHFSVDETNYSTFIKSFKHSFEESSDEDLDKFLNQNRIELQARVIGDLCVEVHNFYQKKTEKHRNKIKTLELIKKYDQERLDQANFPSRATKKISYYETSDSVIKNLLSNDRELTVSQDSNPSCIVDFNNTEYREKQIKFAYALIHLCEWTTLEQVLRRLARYKNYTQFEINFLTYLNETVESESEFLRQFLVEQFIFIYEKFIVELCTEILQVEVDEVTHFFESLLHDKKFLIIKQLCEDSLFKLKMKHLLYELYSYSFCNRNLLKFIDFFL